MTTRYLLLCLVAGAPAAAAQTAFFNDPTDNIQVDGQTTVTGASTYEVVIYFPEGLGGGGRIYNEWTIFEEDKLLQSGFTGGGLAPIHGYNFPAGTLIETSVFIAPNAWHHFAFVYDGAEERLYFDGIRVENRPMSIGIGNGNGPAQIGAIFRDGVLVPSAIAYIQSLRLSDVARYTGLSFPPTLGDLSSDANTQLLYNFNDPAGSTTVQDSGPLGRTGTLAVGFPGATPPVLGPVVANEPPAERDGGLVLHPPAPNPAVGRTAIRFRTAEATRVRLAVVDAVGRAVSVIDDEYRPAGEHIAHLDVGRLAAGLYTLRLISESSAVTTRFVVRR